MKDNLYRIDPLSRLTPAARKGWEELSTTPSQIGLLPSARPLPPSTRSFAYPNFKYLVAYLKRMGKITKETAEEALSTDLSNLSLTPSATLPTVIHMRAIRSSHAKLSHSKRDLSLQHLLSISPPDMALELDLPAYLIQQCAQVLMLFTQNVSKKHDDLNDDENNHNNPSEILGQKCGALEKSSLDYIAKITTIVELCCAAIPEQPIQQLGHWNLEKTLSNFFTILIELGQNEHAWNIAHCLHMRVSFAINGVIDPATYSKRVHIDSVNTSSDMSLLWVAIPELICEIHQNPLVYSLLIVLLLNNCRVLLSRKNLVEKVLDIIQNHQYGLLAWLSHIHSSGSSGIGVFAQKAQMLFRFFHNHTLLNLSEHPIRSRVSLRAAEISLWIYSKSSTSSAIGVLKLMMLYKKKFEASCIEYNAFGDVELCQYFSYCWSLVKVTFEIEASLSDEMYTLLRAFRQELCTLSVNMEVKSGILKEVDILLLRSRSLTEHGSEKSLDSDDWFESTICIARDLLSAMQSKTVEESVAMKLAESLTVSMALLSDRYQNIMGARNLVACLIDFLNVSVSILLGPWQSSLAHHILQCLQKLVILNGIVESHKHAVVKVYLMVAGSLESNPEQCRIVLSDALIFAAAHADAKLYEIVSKGIQNFGGELYSRKKFDLSVLWFDKGCRFLANELSIATLKEEARDASSRMISKFYAICGTCHIHLGAEKDAFLSIKLAISKLPFGDHAGEAFRKLAEKYIKLALRCFCFSDHLECKYPPIVSAFDGLPNSLALNVCLLELSYFESLSRGTTSKNSCMGHRLVVCQKILEFYICNETEALSRARWALECAGLERLLKQESLSLSHCQLAYTCLSNDKHTHRALKIASYSLYALYGHEFNRNDGPSLTDVIDSWMNLLKGIPYLSCTSRPIVPETEFKMDDLNLMKSSLCLLNSYLSSLGLTDLRIRVLQCILSLLHLNPNFRDNFLAAYSFYVQLADALLSLGRSGLAATAFANAKAILVYKCPSATRELIEFNVHYGIYLLVIGNCDKASETYQALSKSLTEKLREGEECEELCAMAYRFSALLSLNQGLYYQSLFAAEIYFRYCEQQVRYFLSKNSIRSQCPKEVCGSITADISNRWCLIYSLLKAHKLMADIMYQRGTFKECAYYLEKGMGACKIAFPKLDNIPSFLDFIVRQQAMQLEMRLITDRDSFSVLISSNYLEPSGSDLHPFLKRRFDFHLALIQTDWKIFCHDHESARKILDETCRNIDEDLKPENIDTFRLCEAFYAACKKDPTLKLKCVPLSICKSRLIYHRGQMLMKQDLFAEAELALQSIHDLPLNGVDLAEFYYLSGNLRLRKLMNALSAHSMISGWSEESVISIPSFCTFRNDTLLPAKLKAVIQALLKNIDSALKYCQYAFKHAFRVGCAELIHNIGHDIFKLYSFSHAYKSSLNDNDIGKTESALFELADWSWNHVIPLELAKGVSLRREKLSLLVQPSSIRHLEWPSPINLKPGASDYISEFGMNSPLFDSKFVSKIPSGWLILSISVSSNMDDVVITRLEKDAPPLSFTLPSSRHAESSKFSKVLEEFHGIIHESSETSKDAKSISSQSMKGEWWKRRRLLDQRLKDLLDSMESCWISGFKGIFFEIPETVANKAAFEEMCKKTKTMILNQIKRASLIEIAKNSQLDVRIISIFASVPATEYCDRALEDIVSYLISSFLRCGIQIPMDDLDLEELCDEYRSILATYQAFSQSLDSKVDDCQPIILILDKFSQALPWESIPSLRGKAVCRLPSMSLLRDLISENGEFEIRSPNGFYVLNPANDLHQTQGQLEPILSVPSGWNGICGRMPSEEEYLRGLSQADVFFYFGHGGAENIVRGQNIQELDTCAATFLMGCSSGLLKTNGRFDLSGTALHYLMGGCRSLVSNLWEVTDRDIDMFSVEMLSRLGLEKGVASGSNNQNRRDRASIPSAVSTSRSVCKLRWLNGAAPVVYGIPLWINWEASKANRKIPEKEE